ncbi:hypothetical protein DPMN_017811 [Dreissena polymorpha]|uniref:Uncharacterized protein n=1 Tax=Dreissena polymorpha TaxID=45954 RepID=A0A9D4NFE1_DREPO|nr:hypothetical protein DPMN_017811 [Dreissena polymorpha]
MVDHVPDHVPPRFLMVDNQIPWSTIKNHGDHGLPWSSFRLGNINICLILGVERFGV